jgi:hypothetical protein
MKMTDHQKRLWLEMLALIQSYLDGKTTDFFSMVGKLEGALDAAELKNREIVSKWYDFWTPLETRRAIEGNQLTQEKAFEELKAMKHFLETQLDKF